MSTVSLISKRKEKPNRISGPNLCSQVGANVSKILHVALLEKCGQRDGQLSPDDIDHVFDLVLNSRELFPVYQQGYKNCVSLKNESQFDYVNENKVMNFVVSAFCRDVVQDLVSQYDDHDEYQSTGWSRAFVHGFADFLSSYIDKDVRSQLFNIYQKLTLKHGSSLTPVTILNSKDVVGGIAKTVFTMKEMMRTKPRMAAQMGWMVNKAIATELNLEHREGGWVENTTIIEFISRLYAPSESNHFRQLVLH